MIAYEPTRQDRVDYRHALQAVQRAVDEGRPVRLTRRQWTALERVTSYRRARARGTYRGA